MLWESHEKGLSVSSSKHFVSASPAELWTRNWGVRGDKTPPSFQRISQSHGGGRRLDEREAKRIPSVADDRNVCDDGDVLYLLRPLG